MTRLYIAGTAREISPDGNGRLDGLLIARDGNDIAHRVRILESYRYIQRWQTDHMGRFRGFMLDSGAFTFMHRGMGRTDPDSYVRRYAEFVRDNDVGLFFEFDVDKIMPYERVRGYRDTIEAIVGRQCIPVWHHSRGMGEWERLCGEYGYVAIGDLGGKETKALYPEIPHMIDAAHGLGAVVHGLGCGGVTKIRKLPFDSVDSASWSWGHKGHYLFNWDGVRMHYDGLERGINYDKRWIARHNFMEWVRFAEDLERIG